MYTVQQGPRLIALQAEAPSTKIFQHERRTKCSQGNSGIETVKRELFLCWSAGRVDGSDGWKDACGVLWELSEDFYCKSVLKLVETSRMYYEFS